MLNNDDKYNYILDNLEYNMSIDNIKSLLDCLKLPYNNNIGNNESEADYENNLINTICEHIYNDAKLLDSVIKFMTCL